MTFVRFGQPGAERPGFLVDEDEILDISPLVPDLGPPTLDRLSELAAAITTAPGLSSMSLDEVRLGSPIARLHKILGIGLNYADDATEAEAKLPAEPVVFSKATSSLSGPFDDIRLPPGAEKVDWEVELGVVVGRLARQLPDESADEGAMAGYTIAHDVSERSFRSARSLSNRYGFPTGNQIGFAHGGREPAAGRWDEPESFDPD